jgi:hypothetical protein
MGAHPLTQVVLNPRLKLLAQFAVGRRQVFGKHARLANRRHEIRVARPARHDVHVDVIGDAGSPGTSQIHSQVETVRVVNFAESRLATLGQLHHFSGRLVWRGVKLAEVGVRRDHQVTADVRIQIENYKVMAGPMHEEVLFVIGGVLLDFAEDTAGALGHVGASGSDVGVPPRAPESLHRQPIPMNE